MKGLLISSLAEASPSERIIAQLTTSQGVLPSYLQTCKFSKNLTRSPLQRQDIHETLDQLYRLLVLLHQI